MRWSGGSTASNARGSHPEVWCPIKQDLVLALSLIKLWAIHAPRIFNRRWCDRCRRMPPNLRDTQEIELCKTQTKSGSCGTSLALADSSEHIGDGSKLQALLRVFASSAECKVPFEGPGIVILASPDLPMSMTGTVGHGIPTDALTVTGAACVQDAVTLGDEATDTTAITGLATFGWR